MHSPESNGIKLEKNIMQSISGYIIQKAYKKLQQTLEGPHLNHIETQ
jgi:hypothetical protein